MRLIVKLFERMPKYLFPEAPARKRRRAEILKRAILTKRQFRRWIVWVEYFVEESYVYRSTGARYYHDRQLSKIIFHLSRNVSEFPTSN
jgi:hypothetical protein